MALSWDGAASAQLAGGAVRPAIIVRVASAPKLIRIWSGVGDFLPGVDNIEADGGSPYLGFGEFASIPVVSQLINGEAERVDFRMGGAWMTGDIAALASTEAAGVRGAIVNMGFLVLDGDLQPLSPIDWCWDGVADSLSVDRQDGGGGQIIRTITLSVATATSGRSTPKPSYWADPFQRQRSADDSFCARVAAYNQGTTKAWPN